MNIKLDKIKQKLEPTIDATAQNLKLRSQPSQASRKTICTNHDSSDEENDYNDENTESDEYSACIYCNSVYSWSRACESWLQCLNCKKRRNIKLDKIKQKLEPTTDATAQNLKLRSQTRQAPRKTICTNHDSSDEENDYNEENIESDEDAYMT
ncbi:Ubiquitin family [Popillia japonica]|uniref:Ubiquitin family n=1 Tax=Popillia japonica TaxID=7064 RepID=A0AAW1MEE1_POPJA